MSYRFDCAEPESRERGLQRAATAVAEDLLVLVATETVYGLGGNAFSRPAVADLRAARRAGRGQPPPVMIGHVRTLDGLAAGIPAATRALAEAFWPGPLTLVCRAQPTLDWGLGDGNGLVSLRMPLHPVLLELLSLTGPLALTGAGLAGSPAARSYEEAYAEFGELVSVYLDSGPLPGGTPSTVVDGTGEQPRLLRAGALGEAELRRVVPELIGLPGAALHPDPEPEPEPNRDSDPEPNRDGDPEAVPLAKPVPLAKAAPPAAAAVIGEEQAAAGEPG